MLFIQPAYRGRGLSALFHEARLDWAKMRKFKRVIVSHRISNQASAAAIRRAGFAETHAENKLWPDGVEADQVFYRLDL